MGGEGRRRGEKLEEVRHIQRVAREGLHLEHMTDGGEEVSQKMSGERDFRQRKHLEGQ